MRPKQLALLVKDLCEDKKGHDIAVLDIRKLSDIAHYFVIVSGNSSPHVRALSDHIEHMVKKEGVRAWHSEGLRECSWVIIDYVDVVVHVFNTETRKYYNLERLWGEAPRL